MKPGIAILGASGISSHYVASFQKIPEVDVIGIYSRSIERARVFARRHNLSISTSNLNELLDNPSVDCVLIATEPSRHLGLALASIQKKKHTLIEKPLSTDILSVHNFRNQLLASNPGVVISVVSQRRFDPALQRMKQDIEAISSGPTLVELKVYRYRDSAYYGFGNNWRNSDSHFFLNQGIHWLDVLLWFWGEPASVKAFNVPNSRSLSCSDRAVAILQWPDGSAATVSGGSFVKEYSEESFIVHHETGTTDYSSYFPQGQGLWHRILRKARNIASIKPVSTPLLDSQALDFCSAILNGKEPTTTLDNAIKALELGLSIEKLHDYSRS